MDIDVPALMTLLSQRRSLFHSEADFQHSLAWQIQLAHPDAEVRLETRPLPKTRLDILVLHGDQRIAIEVKYLLRRLRATIRGELFDLPDHAAHDFSRYDVVKDVVRVERLVTERIVDAGWSLTLTNDPLYWEQALRSDRVDEAFHLHDTRPLTGLLAWRPGAGSGSIRGRETPLAVGGAYNLQWRHFTTIPNATGRGTELRYLPIQVVAGQHLPTVDLAEPIAADGHPAPPPPVAPVPGAITARASVTATARDAAYLAAVEAAASSRDGTFTIEDVVALARRHGSTYADSTIRTHVSSYMCRGAPAYRPIPGRDLIRIDRGRYRLPTD
ncbi:hypothetical protein [Cryptosporangium sp. NPDC051539]|uniref:DUF7669 domain-containing protein n=1 Tax=Cryptosporangium sp. NPDC051539 TaxID=3363962 RepID=UPI0037AD1992